MRHGQVSRSVFKFVARLCGRGRAIFSTYALFIVHGKCRLKIQLVLPNMGSMALNAHLEGCNGLVKQDYS